MTRLVPRASQAGLIGMSVGVLAGLIVSVATYEECEGCLGPDPGLGGNALIGGLLFGAFGLDVGALIGKGVSGDHWVPVDPKLGTQGGSLGEP